jgi:hypothetical protein
MEIDLSARHLDPSPEDGSTERTLVAGIAVQEEEEDESAKAGNKNPEMIVKIVSAEYGPCEGRRLLTGAWTDDPRSTLPYTRDVAPFLRALLLAQSLQQEDDRDEDSDGPTGSQEASAPDDPSVIRVSAIINGMRRSNIPILDRMKGMNACFGDPCPGVSKRLHVSYIVYEAGAQAASAQVYHTSFAEHEKVLLHRRITLLPTDDPAPGAGTEPQAGEEETRKRSRALTLSDYVETSLGTSSETAISAVPCSRKRPARTWRLPTTVSEIVLPMVMGFLEIPERVWARRVCRGWRAIIRDWGVATTIDNNDPNFPPLTRPFLLGLLKHSYSSLQSLFLSGLADLHQEDFHPSIPHLRKLRSLDVSRCVELDDSTLQLLAQHCSDTLEVLYIKGLCKVTDTGMVALCERCTNLRVLEISNIPLTDASGVAIGRRLTKLTAIYMRDNFRLTNESIDSLTTNCHKLEQLTLWGCIRLKHLGFSSSQKLVLLNLWGCHGLQDESAVALEGMVHLRTLIVSECHRLTDAFFVRAAGELRAFLAFWIPFLTLCSVRKVSLAVAVPQLSHLHARYCKRISDIGVNAITNYLENLYTLDLSFCTKVSASAILFLLETRRSFLAELRLHSCRNLMIGSQLGLHPRNDEGGAGGVAGIMILNALRSHCETSSLSALDVRGCGGQPSVSVAFPDNDPFVVGMSSMGFEQHVPGYFVRPACWNSQIERRLVDQYLNETPLVPLQ